jgi:uncharacterized protein (DUF39 family)
MGILQPNGQNVTYSPAGQLSPLLNAPYYRTIGMGTRIFLAGAQGYVSWYGTQFNSACARSENGVPVGGAGTLALTGEMRQMSTEFIKPAVFEGYGTSMFVGVGIPIPVLDTDMLKCLTVEDKDIYTYIYDYAKRDGEDNKLAKVSYAQLRSGHVTIEGKEVRTSPMTSMAKAREIARVLKQQIEAGAFMLSEPVFTFPAQNVVRGMTIRDKAKRK